MPLTLVKIQPETGAYFAVHFTHCIFNIFVLCHPPLIIMMRIMKKSLNRGWPLMHISTTFPHLSHNDAAVRKKICWRVNIPFLWKMTENVNSQPTHAEHLYDDEEKYRAITCFIKNAKQCYEKVAVWKMHIYFPLIDCSCQNSNHSQLMEKCLLSQTTLSG